MGVARRTIHFAIAGVTNVVVTFITLPLATRILSAADYGGFALLSVYGNLGSVLASAGFSYVLVAHLGQLDHHQRRDLISTGILFSIGASTALGAAMLWIVTTVSPDLVRLDSIPPGAMALTIAAMVLAAPWFVVTDVLVLDARAAAYTKIAVAQSVTTGAALLGSLYILDLGALSLFAGLAAGRLIQFLGGAAALRADLGAHFSIHWMRELRRLGPAAVTSNMMETARTILERTVLTAHLGLGQLGLYAHAQQYSSYTTQAVNPISRSLYPVSLEEARTFGGDFPVTQRVWGVAQLAVIGVALTLTLVGQEFIDLISNGKFTAAWGMAVGWQMIMMVQVTGKPQTMTLLAHNRGNEVGWSVTASIVLAVATLVLAVPWFGVAGALAAHGVQACSYRIMVGRRAAKVRLVPFQDWWIFSGMALVASTAVWIVVWEPDFPLRVALLAALTGTLGVAARDLLMPVLQRLHVLPRILRIRPLEPPTGVPQGATPHPERDGFHHSDDQSQ